MHTNGGELGTNKSIGDADFFANFGSVIQPGCPFKQCGHAKALFYYYASLFSQNEFIGVDCEQQDSKQLELNSRFGFFTDGKIGEFCFNTTACFPYTTILQSDEINEYYNITTTPDSIDDVFGDNTNLVVGHQSSEKTKKFKFQKFYKTKLTEPCDQNIHEDCLKTSLD